MTHTTGAGQLLNVVPSDQSALRVAHEIDAFAAVFTNELFDPVAYDVCQFLYRPRIEAAEDASEVDGMRAVSHPTESMGERTDGARCGEKPMHEEDCSSMRVRRRRRHSSIHRDCSSTATAVPVPNTIAAMTPLRCGADRLSTPWRGCRPIGAPRVRSVRSAVHIRRHESCDRRLITMEVDDDMEDATRQFAENRFLSAMRFQFGGHVEKKS
jgi:hypothetical protein